tara:strand:- start:597 stop:1157 length:561 start_codon:yes stop_codon:yes gene_type:complete
MIGTWATVSGDWASQTQTWIGTAMSPDAASLALSSVLPTAGVSYFLSVANGDLTLSTTAPLSTSGHMIYPAKGDLATTLTAPSLGISYVFPVGNADLVLSSTVPTAGVSHFRSPDSATLVILGATKWSNYSGTWAAASDPWDKWTPTIGITYKFTVDSAGNLVIVPGDAPTRTAKDPSYLPTIIIS